MAYIMMVGVLVASHAAGQAVISVDLVDPSDEITQPPPGVVAFDVLVDVAPTDAWTAAGLAAWTFEGARFRYNYYPPDPNYPDYPSRAKLYAPGVENRFVSFASRPRQRDADARFLDEGVSPSLMLCGQPPFYEAFPTRLDVAWFRSPPADFSTPSVDGAIFRVALDVSGACVPSEIVVADDRAPPPGWSPILLSLCFASEPGTAVATFDVAQLTALTWGAYVDAAPTCPGDTNRDRAVELTDLTMLLSSFGQCRQPDENGYIIQGGYVGCADFTGDECVQIDDLGILLAAFGTNCP